MRRKSNSRTTTQTRRKNRKRRSRLVIFWLSTRSRRRLWRAFWARPGLIQVLGLAVVVIALWFGINWAYQVVRKPAELLFPVSDALFKTPPDTWRTYQSIFRKHATAVITPEFLAALAQVEGSGNPIARTYWRWQFSWNPFDVYRPASSAVGMYQITDATFAEARRYCIHDHVVARDGPWNESDTCWFNSLYTRVIPTHAVELTAAYLDRQVANVLEQSRIVNAKLNQQQNLAAVIHLCGTGAGETYARRKLQLLAGQRCGEHDVRSYLKQVIAMQNLFMHLAATMKGD